MKLLSDQDHTLEAGSTVHVHSPTDKYRLQYYGYEHSYRSAAQQCRAISGLAPMNTHIVV